MVACEPRLRSLTGGRVRRIHADLDSLAEALTNYTAFNGSPPDDLLLLLSSDEHEEGWISREHLPVDPWGRGYLMNQDPEGCEVFTLGADGLLGGTGDDADHRWLVGSDGCSCAR